MKKKRKLRTAARRSMTLLLAAVLVLSVLCGAGFAAGSKKTPTRAIAIVFDNSGSMYMNNNTAWCRATYAMEAFAAMMNEGDTLQIYPMNPLTIGQSGTEYDYNNPLTLSASDDITVIERLITDSPGLTPIESVAAACEGVERLSADEKWVIVLTDGSSFYENNYELLSGTKSRLEEMLSGYINSINIMYLGIGYSVAMPTITPSSGHYYSAQQAGNSGDVTNVLIDMGNTIFGRNRLEDADDSFKIDVSMSKLIVFVQGKDISGVSLKDSSGSSFSSIGSQPVKYSEYGDNRYFGPSDTSLSGVLITYGELDAGAYSLEYSGSVSSIGIFYEPDVDLVAQIVDENGNVVTDPNDLYAGEYIIRYGLVDRDGNFTDSKLLGDVNYEITYILNGEEHTIQANQNDEIALSLEANDTLSCRMKATYLKDYTIEKDAEELGWPADGYKISPRPFGKLSIRAADGVDSVKLSEAEDSDICRVEVYYEGEKLTEEQLERVELMLASEGGNAGFTAKRGDDCFLLKLQYAGSAAETECGEYRVTLSAKYTNDEGYSGESAQEQFSFTLEDDSYGVKVRLSAEQTYYVIKDMENGEPIIISLSHDGEEFTDDELAALKLDIDTGGIPYELEPVSGESAYRIVLKNTGVEPGRYTVSCTVTVIDPTGQESSDSDSVRIQLRTYPLWLVILVIVLILAVIFTLLHLYLNTKVLPKRITINDESTFFAVKGKNLPGSSGCSFSGKGKKRGSITISSPSVPSRPLVEHTVTLTVVAVSPRKTKSSRRLARVIAVSAPSTSVTTVSVDGMALKKNAAGKWVDPISPDDPLLVDIGSGSNVMTSGKTVDKTSFTLSAELEFK